MNISAGIEATMNETTPEPTPYSNATIDTEAIVSHPKKRHLNTFTELELSLLKHLEHLSQSASDLEDLEYDYRQSWKE
jgi:hypothetical protein